MANTKRPAAPKVLKPEDDGGLIALDENEDPGFFETREPLFSLGGVTYQARVNFSVSEVTKYSQISRTQGIDAGIEFVLTAALGEDGYKAYSQYPYLRRDAANKVVKQVLDRFLGEEIDPK